MVNRNEYLGRLMVLESARAAVSTKLEAMHAIDLEPDGRTESGARPIEQLFLDEYLPLKATEDEAEAEFRALFER